MDIEAQHAALTTIIFCAVTGKSESDYCRLPPSEWGKWGRAAIAATAALRACEAVPSDARTDALCDSAYIAGAKAGYNIGVDEDAAGLARIIEARSGYLAVLAAPAAPMSAQAPSEAEIDVMVQAYLGDCGPQANRIYSFAHAILSRWGAAPQPPAALPGEQDALEKDRVSLQRRAFIRGWDNRGMAHGLKGGVDTDDHMRKLMDALYPRTAAWSMPQAALPVGRP